MSATGRPAAKPGKIRELIAVNVGNTLEWYDWTIYTIFAHHFAVKFFLTR